MKLVDRPAAIDLHTHSSCSDGRLAPEELVRCAAAAGLAAIAVTDHDTIAGVARALAAGEQHGMEVVPGLEISCFYQDISCHMLGYFFDHTSSDMALALEVLQQRRQARNRKMVSRLRSLGIPITYDELLRAGGEGECGRPHMAALLVEKNVVATLPQAFSRYLGNNGPAYVSRERFDMADAVAMIRNAGGVAVLAHPGLTPAIMADLHGILASMATLGVEGVEVYYPAHGRNVVRALTEAAAELGLAMTGGSDYHGSMGRDAGLGRGAAGGMVPFGCLAALKKKVELHAYHFSR